MFNVREKRRTRQVRHVEHPRGGEQSQGTKVHRGKGAKCNDKEQYRMRNVQRPRGAEDDLIMMSEKLAG